jgi:hypothetical protein
MTKSKKVVDVTLPARVKAMRRWSRLRSSVLDLKRVRRAEKYRKFAKAVLSVGRDRLVVNTLTINDGYFLYHPDMSAVVVTYHLPRETTDMLGKPPMRSWTRRCKISKRARDLAAKAIHEKINRELRDYEDGAH